MLYTSTSGARHARLIRTSGQVRPPLFQPGSTRANHVGKHLYQMSPAMRDRLGPSRGGELGGIKPRCRQHVVHRGEICVGESPTGRQPAFLLVRKLEECGLFKHFEVLKLTPSYSLRGHANPDAQQLVCRRRRPLHGIQNSGRAGAEIIYEFDSLSLILIRNSFYPHTQSVPREGGWEGVC